MDKQPRKRRPAPGRKHNASTPEVNYTPPAPINRRTLVLQLLTVVAVVIAIFAGLSAFFRVDENKCQVSGNSMYSPKTIFEASGINDGESLLLLGKSRAAANIIQKLPYVQSVRIGITLPDTVMIEVVEVDVTCTVQDSMDQWWLVSPEGRVVSKANAGTQADCQVIKGVRILQPTVGAYAKAYEETSDVPVTFTGSQRLEKALKIAAALKEEELLGQIASIDVEKMGNIQVWYSDRFQVKLGQGTRLDEQVAALAQAIAQMDRFQSGVLDVSFENGSDSVGYIPF